MMISKKGIVKNASWIIMCRVVQSLISLVIGMISARYLGPSNYGLIDYARSIIAFAVPIAQLGLRNIMVEEIVSHPEEEGKILGTSLLMSTATSFLCIVGILTFVSIVNAGDRSTLLVCALYSISLVFNMTEMIQYWYQAKLLSKYTSLTSLFAYIIVATYRIFLLITKKSIYWFALSYSLDYFVISAVLFLIYRIKEKQKLSFSFSTGNRLFAKGKYFIISSLMITIFSNTDKIMLKNMISDEANGFYAAAITCAGLSSFVFGAVIDSFRPVIFDSKKYSQESFEKNVVRLYTIVIYMALLQSVCLTLFARPIMRILYGTAFIAAVPVLQIITWYSSFSYMGSVRSIWMLAEGKHKYLWIINLSGASLNIALNVALIPVWGASGAAIASVLTQFFTNFVIGYLLKPIRYNNQLVVNSINPVHLQNIIKSLFAQK